MRGYIRKLQAGEEIDTPVEAVIAERDRVAEEYARPARRRRPGQLRGQARASSRTVFHYVENHNFYVEHWGHSVMWRKIRELSNVL